MNIKWYGHAAFGIFPETGPRIITDPYTPEGVGYSPIVDEADLVVISSDDDSAHCRADLIRGNPVVVNALQVAQSGGNTSALGIDITAIEAAEWDHHPEHDIPGQNGMYRFTVDGIKCAHMGDVGNPLTESQQDFFADTDVLFALAGGYLTLELPDLMDLIRRVQPRLVIPMHFRTLTYKPRNTLWIESFLNHFKEENITFACSSSIQLQRASIPDHTQVLVMDYVR